MQGGRTTVAVLAIALIVGLGATEAWAQPADVDPHGPSRVESDDVWSLYEACIWTDYNFWWEVSVFHNLVQKEYSLYFVYNDGPGVYFAKWVYHGGWGMQEGDRLDYLGCVTVAEGPYYGYFTSTDLILTVQAPCAKLNTPKEEPAPMPTPYAMREETA